jgi:hypothetical protein
VVLDTEAGARITFNDARRFGAMDLRRRHDVEAHWLLKGLGPEPLGNAFNDDHLARAFGASARRSNPRLLDQRIVAGLGNIYVCEALHRAGISPLRHAGRIGRGPASRACRRSSATCWPRRSRPGAHRSATTGRRMAIWAISSTQFPRLRPRGGALPNPRLPRRHPPQGAVRAVEFLLPHLPKIA